MKFDPLCNTEVIFSTIEQMKTRLMSLSVNNIVMIINESSVERWSLQHFINGIQSKYRLTWIKSSIVNPTQLDIYNALEQIGNKTIDIIIAFGGGSVIDLAKGISAFYDKDIVPSVEYITNCIKHKTYEIREQFIDIIAIPSTSGTGSELTQWATIWDIEKTMKFSIDDPRIKPKIALIVPELTLTLPTNLTLSTGLDALAHAMEAYWSKYTTPIVQDIAYRAISLIIDNLSPVIQNPSNINLREKMCRASVLAGLAFSKTRTTACHSISYPMTILYGVPHGLAAAMTLDVIGQINRGHFPNDEDLFKLFREFDGIQNWMDDVCDGVLKLRLSSFGIVKNDIELLVNKSFTGGRMENNPVNLSENDVNQILHSIL